MGQRAIITGILGQDGSYLAEHLLNLNYDVYGIYRRISSGNNYENVVDVEDHPRLHLVEGDICDIGFMRSLISALQPDEFYNLAAQSHVGYSFKTPVETFRVNAEAVIGQLESIKETSPDTRYYQASTSELFGGINCPKDGYDEDSPFHPRSPYAVAKLAAFHAVVNYREAYGIHAGNGILFNHSSPRRGVDFATRKITKGIAAIQNGFAKELRMGNLEAYRDEGHAEDYVKAMYLMLQQDTPDDYVVCTGETASIRMMLEYVAELAGFELEDIYVQDKRYMRPSDVPYLLGKPDRIKEKLNWEPQHNWQSLLQDMYKHDLMLY